MSQRALSFADRWIADNVVPEAGTPSAETINAAVAGLLADADEEGIPRGELSDALGDVRDYLLEAFAASGDEQLNGGTYEEE